MTNVDIDSGTVSVTTVTSSGNVQVGGNIVADANEAKEIFAAVTSNTITIGGTGSTTAVDSMSIAGTLTLSGSIADNTNTGACLKLGAGNVITKGTCTGARRRLLSSDKGDSDAAEFSFSDRRLKENISTLGDALASLEKVRGVTYSFNADAQRKRGLPHGEQVGVVAQELEAVLPQLVATGKDGIKGVNYPALTAFLIQVNKEQEIKIAAMNEAQKEQQAKLEKQAADMKETRREMAELKALILRQEGVTHPAAAAAKPHGYYHYAIFAGLIATISLFAIILSAICDRRRRGEKVSPPMLQGTKC
jgi:hypothetical protein